MNLECRCGAPADATCIRCGERVCADHYVLSVADDYADLPAARTPNGVVTLDLFGPARRAVYRAAYAAGGPGCMRCRTTAAEHAVTEAAGVAERLTEEFLQAPDVDRLRRLMEHGLGELLRPEQERLVVAAAFRIREPNCDAVEVRVVRRLWRGYAFVEVRRTPAVSFDDLVVTGCGAVYAATRTVASVPVERLTEVRLSLILRRGEALPPRVTCSFRGRNSGWGMDDPPRWALSWDHGPALTPRGPAPSMLAELTAAALGG